MIILFALLSLEAPDEGVITGAMLATAIPLYFIPTVAAVSRKDRQRYPIHLVNLFFRITT